MRRVLYLFLVIVMLPSASGIQIHAQAPADTSVYAVSYVDVMPAARASMIAALKQYRDASRKDDGYVRFDLLEQVGWPGHFAIVETWRDQKAFDAHGTAAHAKQYRSALEPIRVSGYDQRPYKTLTAAPAAAADAQAVYVVAHVDIAGQGAQAEAPGMLGRLAEASRKEPGNARFDVLQHMMRANHFTVVETWQSQNAHAAHAAAVHTKQYRDTLQPISGSPLDERLYKAVE
jgi:quinol monooxygenase YgiN